VYTPDTILERKEPKENAYDKVRVVGPSPISFSATRGEWGGRGAQDGVIIEPVEEHDSTIDVPLGQLQELYSVVSEGEPLGIQPTFEPPKRVDTRMLKSPEDVFAEAEKAKPPVRGAEEEVAPVARGAE
jgi:hypothetical protein